MSLKKSTIRELCYIGTFTAIIAICAQLIIPMPYGVPMTLQTFAIALAGVILGAKNGALSTLGYVLLGSVGAPVFAGFAGGLGVVAGPTGGFILSFPIIALSAGIGGLSSNNVWLAFALVSGVIINYICGMLFFDFIMLSGIKTSFIACVMPYIPTDIIKVILVAALGRNIKAALSKSGVLA